MIDQPLPRAVERLDVLLFERLPFVRRQKNDTNDAEAVHAMGPKLELPLSAQSFTR